MKTNPTRISWQNPTTRIDGSAYDASVSNAGYELSISSSPDTPEGVVTLPLQFGTEFDLTTLAAYQALPRGVYYFALAVVDKGGLKSTFSTSVPFQIDVAPSAPSDLVVA